MGGLMDAKKSSFNKYKISIVPYGKYICNELKWGGKILLIICVRVDTYFIHFIYSQ